MAGVVAVGGGRRTTSVDEHARCDVDVDIGVVVSPSVRLLFRYYHVRDLGVFRDGKRNCFVVVADVAASAAAWMRGPWLRADEARTDRGTADGCDFHCRYRRCHRTKTPWCDCLDAAVNETANARWCASASSADVAGQGRWLRSWAKDSRWKHMTTAPAAHADLLCLGAVVVGGGGVAAAAPASKKTFFSRSQLPYPDPDRGLHPRTSCILPRDSQVHYPQPLGTNA